MQRREKGRVVRWNTVGYFRKLNRGRSYSPRETRRAVSSSTELCEASDELSRVERGTREVEGSWFVVMRRDASPFTGFGAADRVDVDCVGDAMGAREALGVRCSPCPLMRRCGDGDLTAGC